MNHPAPLPRLSVLSFSYQILVFYFRLLLSVIYNIKSFFLLINLPKQISGSRGPGIGSPSKGLLFNSHWHVAEHHEIGRIKEFELFERSEFSNSRQISGRARCPKGRVTRVSFLLVLFFGQTKKTNRKNLSLAEPFFSDLARRTRF